MFIFLLQVTDGSWQQLSSTFSLAFAGKVQVDCIHDFLLVAHCCHFGLHDGNGNGSRSLQSLLPSLALLLFLLLLLLLWLPPFVVVYWPLMMLLQPLHIMRASSLLLLPQHLLIPLFSLSQLASCLPLPMGVCCCGCQHQQARHTAGLRTQGSGIRISSHFVLGCRPMSLTFRVAAVADNKG